MKLIKRALIAFALMRIAQNLAFGFRVAKLEQELNDEDNPLRGTSRGSLLKGALEGYKVDLKEAQIRKAQVLVSKEELRKRMIESYV